MYYAGVRLGVFVTSQLAMSMILGEYTLPNLHGREGVEMLARVEGGIRWSP